MTADEGAKEVVDAAMKLRGLEPFRNFRLGRVDESAGTLVDPLLGVLGVSFFQTPRKLED